MSPIMHKSLSRLLSSVACLALLTGCVPALTGDAEQEKAALTVPESFGPALPSEAQTSTARMEWQAIFPDPVLQGLIGTALKNNQELRILEQEIAISDNEVSARQGEYLPKVDIGAGYELEKVGEHTSQGVSDEAHELSSVLHNHQAGLFASWEVDIWKKLRNAKQSAYYRYLASVEGRKFAQTQLIAEIASTYYELLALDQQLEIVTRYIDTLQQAQEVVQYQQQAAQATSLAVNRFSAEVLKNKSLLYKLQQKVTVTENRLNALVGRFPQPLARDAKQFLSLTPPEVHAGLPADLLENRPDIQQATLDMKAAELDVSVAKARFYPSLSLDAGLGFEAFNAKYFLNSPESVFYNVAANLTAPLINRMAIEADYRSSNSRQLQSIYHYQQTVINAFVEVVNQLSAIRNMQQTYASKEAQVKALNDAVDISGVLFKAARIDYLESLLTQRDALEAQMELVESKQQLLAYYVNLYRALGGGGQQGNTSPPADATSPEPAHLSRAETKNPSSLP